MRPPSPPPWGSNLPADGHRQPAPGMRPGPKAIGCRVTTDRLDAELIARFAAQVPPSPARCPMPTRSPWPSSSRAAVSSSIRSAPRPAVRAGCATRAARTARTPPSLAATEDENIERSLDGGVRASPLRRHKEDLLMSVPGTGPTTARVRIADLPGIGSIAAAPPSRASPPRPRRRCLPRAAFRPRRPRRGSAHPPHGRPHVHPSEPADRRSSRSLHHLWQARPDRLQPQAPQRCPEGPPSMAKRPTGKTIFLSRSR